MKMPQKESFGGEAVRPAAPLWMTILTLVVALLTGPAAAGLAVLIGALGTNWMEPALVCAGVGFFPVGLAVLVAAKSRTARKLNAEGVLTDAYIVARWYTPDEVGNIFWVAYEFGERHRSKQRVWRSDYDRLQVGDRVTVRYLPDRPWHCRMEL